MRSLLRYLCIVRELKSIYYARLQLKEKNREKETGTFLIQNQLKFSATGQVLKYIYIHIYTLTDKPTIDKLNPIFEGVLFWCLL